MKSLLVVCLAALAVCLATAKTDVVTVLRSDLNLVELADRLGFHSYLQALTETGLLDTVQNTGNLTRKLCVTFSRSAAAAHNYDFCLYVTIN